MIGRIEAADREVVRALRARSGMERLRLAHETWSWCATGSPPISRPDIQSGHAMRSTGASRTGCWMTQADLLRHLVDVFRQVPSDLHLRDVLGILRVSEGELDERYLTEWSDRLGLRALWEQVRTQA